MAKDKMIKWTIKTDKIGNCECGNMVPCIYNYCPWCGIKLDKPKLILVGDNPGGKETVG